MNTFHLNIVAVDKMFYDGPCEALTIPAVDGEKGILANHEPMVMALSAGELRYTVNGTVQLAAVGVGFVEVARGTVVVLTDFALKPEDIDVERAENAKARAEERMREQQSKVEFAHSEAAMARALARMKVAKKTGKVGSRR